MPCNSDYLQPNWRELELRRAASLLVYVLQRLGRPIPAFVQHEVNNIYASDERLIPALCAVLKALDTAQIDAIVYDARNPASRQLADWWEEHQRADAKREAENVEREKQGLLRKQALEKLTDEERKALGL